MTFFITLCVNCTDNKIIKIDFYNIRHIPFCPMQGINGTGHRGVIFYEGMLIGRLQKILHFAFCIFSGGSRPSPTRRFWGDCRKLCIQYLAFRANSWGRIIPTRGTDCHGRKRPRNDTVLRQTGALFGVCLPYKLLKYIKTNFVYCEDNL